MYITCGKKTLILSFTVQYCRRVGGFILTLMQWSNSTYVTTNKNIDFLSISSDHAFVCVCEIFYTLKASWN